MGRQIKPIQKDLVQERKEQFDISPLTYFLELGFKTDNIEKENKNE